MSTTTEDPLLAFPNSAEAKVRDALAASDRELAEQDAAAEAVQPQLTKRSALAECEKVIDKGRKAFVEVGRALQEIRDKRLYRQKFDRFEDYLQTRWDFSRTYAHYVIGSHRVVQQLRVHNCEHLPESEAQCRPLRKVKLEEVAEVWQEAVESRASAHFR